MTHVAIFFVPTGAKQRDFEEALREHFAELQKMDEVPLATAPAAEAAPATELPLWTWFLPNPRPHSF